MPRCCDHGIDVVMEARATSLLRWLWQHICFHLVPHWMHKCVVFDLGIWLHFIPGGCMHMDEIQTSVVTPPLDLHWDQKHVPAWNVNYKVGISPASKKVSPRTCFRYQSTRHPTRSSRCQPPQPVLELGDVCPCIFYWWALPTKSQSYQPGEIVIGAFRTYDYYYCNLWGSRRHPRVSWPLLAVFSGQWRLCLPLKIAYCSCRSFSCNPLPNTKCLNYEN